MSVQPIDIERINEEHSLTPHVEYIVDKLGKYDVETLVLPNQQWETNTTDSLSFGYTDSIYWFRFEIQNNTSKSSSHLLEIAYPVLDDIELYVFDVNSGERRAKFKLGDKMPFELRKIQHRHFVMPLNLEHSQAQIWVLRVQTSSSMQLPMTLWKERTFFLQEQSRLLGLGVYYGIMLVVFIYNGCIFILVREKNYLYYVLYTGSMATFLACLQGLSFQYAWPNATSWNDSAIILMLSGIVIFGGMFTRGFLKLSKSEKLLDYTLVIIISAASLIVLATTFIPYSVLIRVLIGITVVGIIICIGSGTLRWVQGYAPARYYTIAWSSMLFGGVTLASNKLGIVSDNFFTTNAIQLGSAFEVILLSFALAVRLNKEKRERFEAQADALNHERIASSAQEEALVHEREAIKAQAQALEIQRRANDTLEKKVKERTVELEIANEKLADLSTTDGLTGVRNRRFFDDSLEGAFNHALREHEPLSILILDIDYFKAVNDEYGHQVGDDAIVMVARVLSEIVYRVTDIFARYGGEEFAIALPNTNTNGAFHVAEKIRKRLSEEVVEVDEICFSLTVSIGIMSKVPSADENVDSWIKEADDALYIAKANGRNQSVMASACAQNQPHATR